MTKQQIVNETIEFYSKNPRSIRREPYTRTCLYNGQNGTVCAFSRVIKPESRHKLIENKTSDELLSNNTIQKEDFLPEYQNLSEDFIFWKELQLLHDKDIYWNEKKLTDTGRKFAKSIYS